MRKSTKLTKKADYFVNDIKSWNGLPEEQQIISYRKYIMKVAKIKQLKKDNFNR